MKNDDLLELFQELIEDGRRSILFFIHITRDLDKCANYITYIVNGRIIENRAKDDLTAAYRVVKGTLEQLPALTSRLISSKENAFGFAGLIRRPTCAPVRAFRWKRLPWRTS